VEKHIYYDVRSQRRRHLSEKDSRVDSCVFDVLCSTRLLRTELRLTEEVQVMSLARRCRRLRRAPSLSRRQTTSAPQRRSGKVSYNDSAPRRWRDS